MVGKDEHKFWSTQPVKIGDANNIIKKPTDIKKTPIDLPPYLHFVSLKLSDLPNIYNLLYESYVEDEKSDYRLNYSLEFLKWQFENPNHKEDYLLGLKNGDKLCGFAFGREHLVVLDKNCKNVISVNFLCIVKELRNKRLAPIIIQEMTRRANINNIFCAVFTGGIKLPFKITSSRYFHRIFNRDKLCKLGFCDEAYEKNEVAKLKNGYTSRLIEEADLNEVYFLYKKECEKYKLFEKMNFEEFKHNFTPRKDVIYTFVYEKDGVILDFGTFYILNTLVIKKNEFIKTAYLYSFSNNKNMEIIDVLVYHANNLGVDLFNCLEMMGLSSVLKEKHFFPGDGVLNYYFFNWEAIPIDSSDNNLIFP